MFRKNAILVVAAIVLTRCPAAARQYYRLIEPTAACVELKDARHFARSPASSLDNLAGTSCRRLSGSSFQVDQDEGDFACLHLARRECLWVPYRLLKGNGFDDGVF